MPTANNTKHVCCFFGRAERGRLTQSPAPSVANGVAPDVILFSAGHWWLIINAYEYALPILNCPYCGVSLPPE